MKKKGFFIIAILLLICMSSIWPLCLIRRDVSLPSGGTEPYSYTETISAMSQEFIAQEAYLTSLSFALTLGAELPESLELLFTLHDKNGNVLTEKNYTMADLQENSYCTVDIDRWIKKGDSYTFSLTFDSAMPYDITMPYTPSQSNFAPGNIRFICNDMEMSGQAYTKYDYKEPLNKNNILFSWLFIWIIGFSLWEMFGHPFRRKS